ncbi:hypothetical protein ABFX02_05G108800 [Erythranthe guttata]
MGTKAQFLFFFFFFFTVPTQSANSCEPVSCDHITGPEIRFPFRLANRQPVRCGYPGFDLYCNSRNQTILNLPQSGEFVVDYIDYRTPAIYIDDPGSCLPNRSTSFSPSDSPFRGSHFSNYVLINCSDNWADYAAAASGGYVELSCLSGRNSTVLAAMNRPGFAVPEKCRKVAEVSVPLAWAAPQLYGWPMDLSGDFELVWSEPPCGRCEKQGGVCGFEGDSGLQIGCSGSRSVPAKGLPRGAKYAIIVGVGIPGLICTIGLACYSFGLIKTFRHRPNPNLPTTATFSDQRSIIRSTTGLDGPTIESYPKTVLGESRRLPNPADGTCPICLCDYEPKETLRSVPECNHYFHAGCIDEWLKLNGTCPLCRNSPESSSTLDTPCSSGAFSSSSSSTTSPEHR